MSSLYPSIVPPFKTEGTFVVRAPFALEGGKIHICEEIRSFEELNRLGKNVLQTIYLANNLTEKMYLDDLAIETSIVTLKPIGGAPVHIPSTYIISYPGMKGSGYTTKVLVLEIGLMPLTYNIDDLKVELADHVKKSIGVDVAVSDANQIYDKQLSPSEQARLEKTRRLAMENYISKDERIETTTIANVELTKVNGLLSDTVISLNERIAELEALLPPEQTR